jgi:hypothetical protein
MYVFDGRKHALREQSNAACPSSFPSRPGVASRPPAATSGNSSSSSPRDRSHYLRWLYEACKRFGLCVLDYMVTSNHVYLRVKDTGEGSTQRPRALLRHAMVAGPNPSLLGASASLTASKANWVTRQCTGKSVPRAKPLFFRNRCRLAGPISISKMPL